VAVTVAQQTQRTAAPPIGASNQRAQPPNLGGGETLIQMELLPPIYRERFSGPMRVHEANLLSDYLVALSTRRAAELSHFSKRVTCKVARSHVERDAIFKLGINPPCAPVSFLKIPSGDTLNPPTMLPTPTSSGCMSTTS